MKYRKYTLNNGIRVILAPLENTESITVHIGFKVGSVDESKQINGLSHFLEHMMFKGTKKRPSTLAIAQELDSIGGQYNAYTHKEYTAYFIKVLPHHFDIALDVLSDMLRNSLFDENEIEREKGVIIEEINLYQDTPSRYIGDLFEKTLWGDSFLGQEIIGNKENILKFKRAHLLEHLENFYVGENMVVTIAGKLKGRKIIPLIKKFFSSLKKKGLLKTKIRPDKIAVQNKNIVFLDKNTDQTHIAVGFKSFPLTDQRKYALHILAIILGGNMSSRFFIDIRERLGLCYYISTDAQHYLADGYFTTYAGVKNDQLDLAVEKIILGYKAMAREGVTQKELLKAKEYLKGTTLLHLEESQAVAEFLARQEILLKKILTFEEIFEIINKITVQDLQKIWQEIFSLKNIKIACIGPQKNRKKLDSLMKM